MFGIQEILHVADVIFIWRSEGVLNDTIWIFFADFSCFLFYGKVKGDYGETDRKIPFPLQMCGIQEILHVEDVAFIWRSEGVLNDKIWIFFADFSCFLDYGK